MASRDEIRLSAQAKLTWVVVGSGPEPRCVEDMRAIVEWIDRAVDAWLLDPNGFEGTMLQAMHDGLFTVATIANGQPYFQLTEYGRARVDSMPHDLQRFTMD